MVSLHSHETVVMGMTNQPQLVSALSPYIKFVFPESPFTLLYTVRLTRLPDKPVSYAPPLCLFRVPFRLLSYTAIALIEPPMQNSETRSKVV